MHQPGIEPGPLAWKASILTTGLLVLGTSEVLLHWGGRHGIYIILRATGIEPVTN